MVVEKFRGIFIQLVMKMSDGTPTTEPLFWEKSLAGKGSLDCHKQRSQPALYLNVEQQTGPILVVGLDLQVMYTVPSTLVLFILRDV